VINALWLLEQQPLYARMNVTTFLPLLAAGIYPQVPLMPVTGL
jgi:hypothetical protein